MATFAEDSGMEVAEEQLLDENGFCFPPVSAVDAAVSVTTNISDLTHKF